MTADPWALLREAEDLLAENVCGCLKPACLGFRNRLAVARIEAALAERQDSAKDDMEWEVGENYEGKHWWDTTIGDRAVHVEAWDKGGTRFYWRVFSTLDEEGHQPTLADAKSAAIEAARGMR